MVEANLYNGPIHFNYSLDLTISLDDGAPEKALTLNIETSGYDMIEGSRPLALIYRIYYKLLKTNLNAQALSKSPRVKTLLLQCSSNDINTQVPKVINWNEVKLPTEWLLENEMPPRNIPTENTKLDRIEQYLNGTVKICFDHSKQKNPLQIKYGNSNPRHSYTGSSSSDIK